MHRAMTKSARPQVPTATGAERGLHHDTFKLYARSRTALGLARQSTPFLPVGEVAAKTWMAGTRPPAEPCPRSTTGCKSSHWDVKLCGRLEGSRPRATEISPDSPALQRGEGGHTRAGGCGEGEGHSRRFEADHAETHREEGRGGRNPPREAAIVAGFGSPVARDEPRVASSGELI
jgi:hypothetical protein